MVFNYTAYKSIFEEIQKSDFSSNPAFPCLKNNPTKRSDKPWYFASLPQNLVDNVCFLDTTKGQADRVASIAERLLARKPKEKELLNLLDYIVNDNLNETLPNRHESWFKLAGKRDRVEAIKKLYNEFVSTSAPATAPSSAPQPTTSPTTSPAASSQNVTTSTPKTFNYNEFQALFEGMHIDLFSKYRTGWYNAANAHDLVENICGLDRNRETADRVINFATALIAKKPQHPKLLELLNYIVTQNLDWHQILRDTAGEQRKSRVKTLYQALLASQPPKTSSPASPRPTIHPQQTSAPTTEPVNYTDSSRALFTFIHSTIFKDFPDKSWVDAKDPAAIIHKICLLDTTKGQADRIVRFTEALLTAAPQDEKLKELLAFLVNHLTGKGFEDLQKETGAVEKIQKAYQEFLGAQKTKTATPTVTVAPKGGLLNLGNTCWMNSLLRIIASTHRFDSFLTGQIHDCKSDAETTAFRDLQQKLTSAVTNLRTSDSISREELDALANAFVKAFAFLPEISPYTRGNMYDTQEAIRGLDARLGHLPKAVDTDILTFNNSHQEMVNKSSSALEVEAEQEGVALSTILSSLFQSRAAPTNSDYFFIKDSSGAVINYWPTRIFLKEMIKESCKDILTEQEISRIAENEALSLTSQKIVDNYGKTLLKKYAEVKTSQLASLLSRKMAFAELTQSMQINIKRTNQKNPGDATARAQVKDVYTVRVDEELNLGQYLRNPENRRFKLDAVFLRSGEHIDNSSGHNYCAIRDGSAWVLYNDGNEPRRFGSFNAISEIIYRDAQSLVYTQVPN